MKRRLTALAMVLLATACSREGQITQGGIYITRSACPQVGIPAATGDITLEELVAHVVVHELGHHFGWSDEEMHVALDED